MNFMKDNCPFKKFPSKRKKQTINFFQTVREGRRTFAGSQKAEENCGLEAPWISGRRFIQPTRRVSSSYRTGVDVKTILSNLEQSSTLGSTITEDKASNFFNESSSEDNTKKKKSLPNVSRIFKNTVHNNDETSSSGQANNPNLPVLSSRCKQEVGSSVEGLPPSAESSGKQLQPSSRSNCQSHDNHQFFRMSTPKPKAALANNKTKRSLFVVDFPHSDPDTSNKENASIATAVKRKSATTHQSFSQEIPISNVQPKMLLSTQKFSPGIHHHTNASLSHVEFFKKPTQPPKINSNEGFFKTPKDTVPKKPNSQESFFKDQTIKIQTPTSNYGFFKPPSMQQNLYTKNEFFENTAVQSKDTNPDKGFFNKLGKPISSEGFFNLSPMKQQMSSSREGFFESLASQQYQNSDSKEFFNTGTGQPLGFFKDLTIPTQKSSNKHNRGFFKTVTMKNEKPTLKEEMFAMPPQRTYTNVVLVKSPVSQLQKTPSFDEFLRPHLNPQTFSSGKMAESDPSSSDYYESLFTTPSKVKSLPKMTTPHLFQPVEKPPSKTSATPISKTTSKTTTKTTNVSNEDPTYYVLSVTEGRGCAICEIGVAAIDLKHPELILCQFSDVPTYKKLLTKINLLDAAELLMPETFTSTNPSEMYKKVTETFPDVRMITAKRIQFSATNGLESVRQLMLPDDSSVEVIIYKKYYALAATEALLRYIEVKHSILFSPKTLKVSFQGAKDVIAMDFETCQRLELVLSSASVLFPEKYSLFGLLNCTKTMGGKRRLRASLMQPSCSQEHLERRISTVSVLAGNQALLASLQTVLLKFSTVERILWLCRRTPNFKHEAKVFDFLTNYILLLKGSLEAIPHLRKVLEAIDDDHIINIRNELSDEYYELMLIHIKKMIRQDARLAKGYASSSRERCFAINEGVNDLLDLARATYSDLVEQVLKMVTELAEEYTLPLKMTHTPDMGFHASYTLPRKMFFNKDEVPNIFTEVKTKNRTVHLLTDEMFNLNVRISRAMEEIQLITNVLIYDLVESLKEGMSYLYRLCDRVADLDLLSSLAQVSSTPDYVRPVFGSWTSLIGARHPIMDHLCPTKPIPNNITALKTSNFNIITGPNMSGKTVYVLTLPLIQIMAQVGCYVPADKAELRITDHIFVRKGNTDNMQCKLSVHGVEIKELLYTLKILTSRSLIVLDELCANTSCERGICLAWAFCEQFLRVPAFTFLTTHYHYLCNLSEVYKNVTNFQLEAIERSNDPLGELTFTHRLLPGVTQMSNYALRLMMSSALPEEVKQYALDVAEDLKHRREANLPVCTLDDPMTAKELAKMKKLENFMSNLKAVCKTDKFTPKLVRALQRMVQEEILSDLESDDDMSNGGSEASSSIVEEHNTFMEDMEKKTGDEGIEKYLDEEQEMEHQQMEYKKVIPTSQVQVEKETKDLEYNNDEDYVDDGMKHSEWKSSEHNSITLNLNNRHPGESDNEGSDNDENENQELIVQHVENLEINASEIFIELNNDGLLMTEDQPESPSYKECLDQEAINQELNCIRQFKVNDSPLKVRNFPIVEDPQSEDGDFGDFEESESLDSTVFSSASSVETS